jgi:hypothetical protein
VREIIDCSLVMAGQVCCRANGGNDAALHSQKNIPAHTGTATIDKASRYYESCFVHEYCVSFAPFPVNPEGLTEIDDLINYRIHSNKVMVLGQVVKVMEWRSD